MPPHHRPACLTLLVALVLATNTSWASPDSAEWMPVKNEEHVAAWKRQTAGNAAAARAVTTIAAPLCVVLAVVRDVSRHCQWMADCVGSRVVQRTDWSNFDLYLRIRGRSLLGVADRDVVLRTQTILDAGGRRAEVRFSNLPPPHPALAPECVPMPRLAGAYTLQSTAAERTRVEYNFEANLGGWVPPWVAKRTVEHLPWQTLVSLRKQVTRLGSTYGNEIQSWPPVSGLSPCARAAANP